MSYQIGDIVMYDKKVLRTTSCWRYRCRGEYEWRESEYQNNRSKYELQTQRVH